MRTEEEESVEDNKFITIQTNTQTNSNTAHNSSFYNNTIDKFKHYSPQSDVIDILELRRSKYLKIKKSKGLAYYG